ncbi:hypothetical protein K443DRAFT_13322 [Laccaria amethystina LaAM-08-1]|uniref:Apurinic-apyrimidinic endonuclease 1 n=1 Tax=Laccaria amethystina LaAM-08-1 TaxID=1095629 RepID=A0A0C9WVL7_9AGAR|nr:hypothetical protein K443DRAFT_13322 [Laccaria amethystina LaAM-08-1]
MVTTRRASALATDDKISEPPLKKARLDKNDSKAVPEDVPEKPKVKAKRKTKAQLSDPNTFLARVESPWKVGAHVSAVGGVENTIVNARAIGANAFALFLKSQRKWTSPALSEESIATFKERMKEYGYSPGVVLPHGSYLINLGNPDADKRKKSYDCFLDDLKRCEQLGLTLYNFHPGSTVGACSTDESLSLIAECINQAHKETTFVTIVLENMAGAGNIIGGDFAHLAGIIERIEDKTRVGVCLDTCHSFAAGYDIRTKEGWESTLTKFDNQVGLSYLRGMHLNDSKTEFNSKRDRHENIGLVRYKSGNQLSGLPIRTSLPTSTHSPITEVLILPPSGHIGILAFQHILNDPRVQNIPLILETPSFEQPAEVWGKEIEVLMKLSGSSGNLGDGGPSTKLEEGGSAADEDASRRALEAVIRASVKLAEGESGAGKLKKAVKAKEKKVKGEGRKRKKGVDSEEDEEECDHN